MVEIKKKGKNMEERKHRLVIDGNAFYEIDLECEKKKKDEKNKKKTEHQKKYKRGCRTK